LLLHMSYVNDVVKHFPYSGMGENRFMKYSEWLEVWLENYVKPSAKVRTYEKYICVVERHTMK